MVVRPWVMVDSVIDFRVRIARAFGAELPYRPVFSVFVVQPFDEIFGGVPVSSLWICRRGARGSND